MISLMPPQFILLEVTTEPNNCMDEHHNNRTKNYTLVTMMLKMIDGMKMIDVYE